MIDLFPDAAVELTVDGRITAVNDLAAELFGRSAAQLRGRRVCDLIGAGADRLAAALHDTTGPVHRRVEVEGRRADGTPFPLDAGLRRRDGRTLLVLRDRNVDGLASLAQRFFDAAFDVSPIGMALFDSDGRYVRVNASLCEMLGRDADDLVGRRDQELTHTDDRQADLDAAWRILGGERDTWQTQKRFVRADGVVVWAIANLTFLRDERGRGIAWLGQFQDITQLHAAHAAHRHMAEHDELTGLFNRRRFAHELERQVAHSLRYDTPGALVMLDLDHFKAVNDTLGHRAGDDVLVAVAAALGDRIRGSDVLARIGGDEFAILLPDAGEEAARGAAAGLTEAVGALRLGPDGHGVVSASAGIALFGRGLCADPDAVALAADTAMYAVKRASAIGMPELA